MRTLPAAPGSITFSSRRYLESLLETQRPTVPKSTPADPAAREFLLEVGERIRDAREAKGWRREDLAHHMGIGFRSVQNYEQGSVSLSRISQLAEVLGVDPRWLLHGDRALIESIEEVVDDVRRLRQHLDREFPGSAEA